MKKIIALTLVLVLCFGLVACGGDTSGIGGKKEPYESAINELRELLDSSYTASELSNPEFHPNFSIIDGKQPIFLNQELLESLYNQFVELGDYQQAKEILNRFSVVEKGQLTIHRKEIDAFGQEHTYADIVHTILDGQGRVVSAYIPNEGKILYGCKIYDDNGNLIRRDNTFYYYNEQGMCSESRFYDNNGFLLSKGVYTYDEQGICAIVYTGSDGSTGTYFYNQDLDLQYDELNQLSYTDIAYNDQGNSIIRKYNFTDGHSKTIYFCVYNDAGNCIDTRSGDLSFSGVDKEDYQIEDYQYEDGFPASITLSNGVSFIYEYSPAYFFNAEGLVLSNN